MTLDWEMVCFSKTLLLIEFTSARFFCKAWITWLLVVKDGQKVENFIFVIKDESIISCYEYLYEVNQILMWKLMPSSNTNIIVVLWFCLYKTKGYSFLDILNWIEVRAVTWLVLYGRYPAFMKSGDGKLGYMDRCTVLLEQSVMYELVQDLRQVITREL